MLRRLTFLAVLLLSLCVGFSPAATAQEATPGIEVEGVTVLAPDELYAGVSRGEWLARWWQWAISFPEEVNPSLDPTGERCGYGQFGPVFFLPANFTGESAPQTCIVPEGTAIFMPIGGTLCSANPPPYPALDEDDLRECTVAETDRISEVAASINGEDVPHLEMYRVVTPPFPLVSPEDNLFGGPEGIALSVSDQYSFIVASPPPGEYEIVLTSRFENEAEPRTRTIRVIVEAPQVIEPEASPATSPEATPVT